MSDVIHAVVLFGVWLNAVSLFIWKVTIRDIRIAVHI